MKARVGSALAASVLSGVLSTGVLLAPSAAGAEEFPTFGWPLAPGQRVSSAGVHSDNGSTGVKNAIDLNPRDDTVRAPLAGTVEIQHCSGGDWVTVDHADGWRTGYYHMENVKVTDGQQVVAGTELGDVGNALPCGGSSSGAHVHFTLWRLGGTGVAGGDWDGLSYSELATEVAAEVGEPLNGKVFGGWTVNEGTSQYSGTVTYARTGEVVELPGTFDYVAE